MESSNELIPRLDAAFIPTLSKKRKNPTSKFDSAKKLLQLPSRIFSPKNTSTTNKDSPSREAFSTPSCPAKKYLFHMMDSQVQYLKHTWHAFRAEYKYSLDLGTFAQSVAVLVAVKWTDTSYDAFIMTSDILKRSYGSDQLTSSFEVPLNEAEHDELEQEGRKFNKGLLTIELLETFQRHIPQIFNAAKEWHACRLASYKMKSQAAREKGKANQHDQMAEEYMLRAREYSQMAWKHTQQAEGHAWRAEAYSQKAETFIRLSTG